uniref:Uncharacterized protein n=1 Tax=Prolemur simus TaxID=1328070 RepID=A0A8C9A3H2_PROSS
MPFPLLVSGGDRECRGASWGNCSYSVELVVLPGGALSLHETRNKFQLGGQEKIFAGEEKLFPSTLLGLQLGV